MTLEKVKYYKTKTQAEMQYGYIVGKNTARPIIEPTTDYEKNLKACKVEYGTLTPI